MTIENDDEIIIDVHGGLCKLKFRSFVSTGLSGEDASPSIGFCGISECEGFKYEDKLQFGMGVIGRKDAAKLRDFLEIFLKNYAAGVRR